MKRRRTVVGVAVALMIGTVLLAGTLDMELIPAADEGVVAVTVNSVPVPHWKKRMKH